MANRYAAKDQPREIDFKGMTDQQLRKQIKGDEFLIGFRSVSKADASRETLIAHLEMRQTLRMPVAKLPEDPSLPANLVFA